MPTYYVLKQYQPHVQASNLGSSRRDPPLARSYDSGPGGPSSQPDQVQRPRLEPSRAMAPVPEEFSSPGPGLASGSSRTSHFTVAVPEAVPKALPEGVPGAQWSANRSPGLPRAASGIPLGNSQRPAAAAATQLQPTRSLAPAWQASGGAPESLGGSAGPGGLDMGSPGGTGAQRAAAVGNVRAAAPQPMFRDGIDGYDAAPLQEQSAGNRSAAGPAVVTRQPTAGAAAAARVPSMASESGAAAAARPPRPPKPAVAGVAVETPAWTPSSAATAAAPPAALERPRSDPSPGLRTLASAPAHVLPAKLRGVLDDFHARIEAAKAQRAAHGGLVTARSEASADMLLDPGGLTGPAVVVDHMRRASSVARASISGPTGFAPPGEGSEFER